MTNNTALFPSFENMDVVENQLTKKLQKLRSAPRGRSATPNNPSETWRSILADFTFDQATSLDELMDWVLSSLDDGIVQMTHPGYLGLFNPAPTFPSECADRIVSAFNPQICVWSHAPKAVEIEQHVIRQLTKRIGLPDGADGHFTSGGAEANSTSVLSALTAKCPEYGEKGVGAFSGRPIIYASAESHLAWFKIAHTAGIGRQSVRLISTDGAGRMDTAALEREIKSDIAAGHVPTMIAATAGTTNAGMVDPLPECAEIANQYDVWFHVDAAWGGAIIACKENRHILAGIEKATSVTIDAHKWFATTMGAGMFFTSRPNVLAEVFRVKASYMPESDAQNDFYVNSAQWSRRFVGLRLFLSLGAAGWAGYSDHVNHSIQLINELTAGLIACGWTRENDSQMGVACMTPPEGSGAVQQYVSRVQESGQYWVSVAQFESRPVLRACLTNGRTTSSDITGLIKLLTK
ncbi:aminotransferase class V-fold PLP-dependent enzyme [Kordiimonas sp. SCSIO 12603]|uniref:pyridoxal phosphate-dependent decarboxylase family protein n=1 Tax=Kordiimonas sp. SCSIO 12603 TaxID=2829596 RepID=UPI002107D229|nr:aminotransferase class V-fold PLP-dependent enzyme [Kordiimonas sp. SCSIO 12603]UTW57129.1 aminotransferase class V-fold PLP-dependent enzyme [Kordiimonas sp. SCSIO 12603]